ncbi:hypothetical protein D8B26_004458 [Coccidioides posadasii str. Silveira]|uniref:STEEP1 domain-containing protein n=2 Tax=Coccidioides posadasii TaxID=199306 RepID=E9DF00_COCPS|nr:hypothetical protein CPC735_021840 [Coccidioides posadasii C735 delta SOWgp]EER22885.1 hypothetical protein CPC735_021840 [Coccidioides posadasii C735 delta SOWgp]EFW15212.1 conserved hypothetical protein [Coccidioides posadasii str. Silveira]QVM09798.1 hypothetical protein D8B26_004458 [Coccidioides posadasii str. Silveira]|eukprot:XP_003065030.1 hypothetical protein CPC735_021840 [Coccidioides posadasii C735 delta SOWgp]
MAEPARSKRKPIRTYHCTFCSHLLLGSTRDILSLPRRKEPSLDRALIVPLPTRTTSSSADSDSDPEQMEEKEGEEAKEEQGQEQEVAQNPSTSQGPRDDAPKRWKESKEKRARRTKSSEDEDYTILLSTTAPDRKPLMVRRADGFEKRWLIRCGRCRVIVAYLLDDIHFSAGKKQGAHEEKEDEGRGQREMPKVVYLLPGAVVETADMGQREIVAEREEWAEWAELASGKET